VIFIAMPRTDRNRQNVTSLLRADWLAQSFRTLETVDGSRNRPRKMDEKVPKLSFAIAAAAFRASKSPTDSVAEAGL
jgi:hypothetical protein